MGHLGYAMDADRKERRERALALLKAGFVRWNHLPDEPPMMVTLVDPEGMIELLGWTGRFGPHLFVPAAPPD